MSKKIVVLVFSLVILLLSCNTTEPPPPGEKPIILLELEDASCTEAWITLTTDNLQLPTTITLKQSAAGGDTVAQDIVLSKPDTLLYIDSLLPNTSYIFQSLNQPINQSEIKSNELSVTTMDTTSHDFAFETFTFGTIGSSTLYDVAIINENNIWCVGDIMIADTSINGYTTYNAVHWDGSQWELRRIYYYGACSAVEYPPLKAIWAFSENNIVMTNGGSIGWFNGNTVNLDCRVNSLLTGSINKIWGSSSSNLYVVGNNGNIAWYNGSQWIRIESGTELQFLDIYGATDNKTGEQQILAVCTRNLPLDKGIYRIEGNTATEISPSPIQWELYAVWFIPDRHYFVIGNGIYEKKFLTDLLWKDNGFDITHYATTGIRGNEINDVFIAGAFGEFLHFNGVSWKSYINETGWFSGSYGGVAVKNNLVITVGYEGAQAKIMMGYR